MWVRRGFQGIPNGFPKGFEVHSHGIVCFVAAQHTVGLCVTCGEDGNIQYRISLVYDTIIAGFNEVTFSSHRLNRVLKPVVMCRRSAVMYATGNLFDRSARLLIKLAALKTDRTYSALLSISVSFRALWDYIFTIV